MNRISLATLVATALLVSACWLSDDDLRKTPTAPQSRPSKSISAESSMLPTAPGGSSVCKAYQKERAAGISDLRSRPHDLKVKDRVASLDELIADVCS